MQLLEKAVSFFEEREGEVIELFLIGPLLLLFSLGLSFVFTTRLDLFFLSSLGLYLSAKWQMKGCSYALIFLTLSSLLHHLFWLEDHLWQLGVEFSFACSFFITALSFEEKKSKRAALDVKIETKEATIQHLEQDLLELKNSSQEEAVFCREKIEALQKELEESTLEQSSLYTLNDVLRKKTADVVLQKEELEKLGKEWQREIAVLQNDLIQTEEELKASRDTDALGQANQRLVSELNALRCEKEQLILDLDDLTFRKEKESQKRGALEKELELLLSEKALLETRLEREEKELFELGQEWQRFSREKGELQMECKALQLEKEALFLKLQERERQELYNKELKERINVLEEMEKLYRQLKQQFQEKDAILHATRTELFQKDTELEALKIEKGEGRERIDFALLDQEIEALEKEIVLLKEENQELNYLISKLSKAPVKRKKKQVENSLT